MNADALVERAAPDTGMQLVQLTSDKARADAHRLSRRLGFVDTHIGFKHTITPPAGGAGAQRRTEA